MSYTEEDIKGMSDREINIQMTYITGGEFIDYGIIPEDQWPVHVLHYVEELGIPNPIDYCHDWSVTGPLMVEYGIGLDPPDKELKDSKYWWANHGIIPKMSRHESQDWDIQVGDKNPLRAICEVILMINLKEQG